jgi:hypothetical protein
VVRRSLAVLALVASAGCFLPVRPPAPPTPPSPPEIRAYTLAVLVTDAKTEQLLAGAAVSTDAQPGQPPFVTERDGRAAWTFTFADFNVCASAPGYQQECAPNPPPLEDKTIRLALVPVEAPRPPPAVAWPPPAREPLPAFPATSSAQPIGRGHGAGAWSFSPYETTLPFDPPDDPDDDFHRGDFLLRAPNCGLRQLESGVAGHPEMVMTWDLPQYDEREQRCIIDVALGRGDTHFLLSIPQCRNNGCLYDGRLFMSAQRVSDTKLRVVMAAFGGDGESTEEVLGHLQMLHAARAIRETVVAWQADFRYDPWELLLRTHKIAEWAHANGVKVSLHWVNEAAAWWNAADDTRRPSTCYNADELGLAPICNRFDYHFATAGLVDYQYLQVDVDAPIEDERPREESRYAGGVGGAIRDVLRSLTSQKLVVAEYDTQAEFWWPNERTEAEGNLKGYLLLCVRRGGLAVFGGFMGGARMPSGAHVH